MSPDVNLDFLNSNNDGEPPFTAVIDRTNLPPIVTVRNAHKSYRKGAPILQGFNMTVASNSIYALLGSSGCGKTTMLSCCVGMRRLDSGQINVFGGPPGSSSSGVPGRRVGFMPQEISLYSNLTIEECLSFYGRIYGMSRERINSETEFLMDFLELPKPSRSIKTLSGGQQRRASVACTLIHGPELLILDEPTVGVDPLLRESIWDYIVKLVAIGSATVVVTTHHIEEARHSHVIGVMRNGRLLTEASPEHLLQKYHTNNLEEVLLTLCRKDQDKQDGALKHTQQHHHHHHLKHKPKKDQDDDEEADGDDWAVSETESDWTIDTSMPTQEVHQKHLTAVDIKIKMMAVSKMGNDKSYKAPTHRKEVADRNDLTVKICRVWALLCKECIVLSRILWFLAFILVTPAIQVILCCFIVGTDVRNVKIAHVSKDAEDCHQITDFETCPFAPGAVPYVSCYFMHFMAKETTIGYDKKEKRRLFQIQNYHKDTGISRIVTKESKVKTKFDQGKLSGYLVFPKNYSMAIGCRFGIGVHDSKRRGCGIEPTDHDVVERSQVKVVIQMSEYHYGVTVQKGIGNATEKLYRLIREKCGVIPKYERQLARLGKFAKIEKINVGKEFKGYVAIGMLLSLLYFFPLCSSSVAYISERKNGTLERMMVAGVTRGEFMGAFMIIQFVLLVCQTVIAFVILYIFGIEVKGGYEGPSILYAVAIGTLVGCSGMAGGFMMSMICEDEVQAILLAIGTFFPNCLLSGILMPVAAAEWVGFEYISYFVPCTLPSSAMRAIIYEGKGLDSWRVILGFVSSIGYTGLYLGGALLVGRFAGHGLF